MRKGNRSTTHQTTAGQGAIAMGDAATPASAITEKRPFDIDLAMQCIGDAVRPFPQAALFELFDEGYTSPFEQLVACIISIRTYDEVMIKTARSVFQVARTPHEMSRLTPEEIDQLIAACTFHEPKARQIHDIACLVVAEHGGALPCDSTVLLSLRGVGPKCANLVLGIACDQPRIGVDIHVHRVTNRLKVVTTRSPEETMLHLEKTLPVKYWVDINRLLVPFGKHICTGSLPRCSTCPVFDMCEQVGVKQHR